MKALKLVTCLYLKIHSHISKEIRFHYGTPIYTSDPNLAETTVGSPGLPELPLISSNLPNYMASLRVVLELTDKKHVIKLLNLESSYSRS